MPPVTLIDGRDRLLPFLDREISDRLRLQMELLGLDVRLQEGVVRLRAEPDTVQLELKSGGSLAPDKRLLGVHIIGEDAAGLVHLGLMVIQAGGTIDASIDAVFNNPTLGDAYRYAAYDGLAALQRLAE